MKIQCTRGQYKGVLFAGYDVPTLSENLDWISLMTYDYHGQWEKKTGHVAPMYAQEDDSDQTFNAVSVNNVIFAIENCLKKLQILFFVARTLQSTTGSKKEHPARS